VRFLSFLLLSSFDDLHRRPRVSVRAEDPREHVKKLVGKDSDGQADSDVGVVEVSNCQNAAPRIFQTISLNSKIYTF
jgi:hypothetical protein